MLGVPSIMHQAGMTALEALIVMAIVAILLVFGMPSMQAWFVSSRVTTKTEAVLNGLQLARAEALKRNARVYFTVNSDFSWTVGCVNAVGDVDGDGVADCPSIIQSRPAEEGGEGGTLAGGGTATFNGIGLITANSDATTPVSQIDISHSSSGFSRTLRVLVTSGGQSRICDPAVTTAGDPAKC